MTHKKLNLYRQYRKLNKSNLSLGILRNQAVPVFLLAVLLLGAWGVIVRQNLGLMDRTDQLQARLDDPRSVKMAEQSQEWDARGQELLQSLEAAEQLSDRLAGYPQIDSSMLRRITRAGQSGISVNITGYDSTTGELQFNAASREVIDIPGYVMALEKTGLFQTVSYTGYSFEDDSYVLRLSCALCPGTGREVQGE